MPPEPFVVITTIHPITRGIERFLSMPHLRVALVGDTATPAYPARERLTFLGVERQRETGFDLAGRLPFKHYCRKNLGYLWAMREGAAAIYDTDDDNIPYDHWGFPPFECDLRVAAPGRFANVYKLFTPSTEERIWPRGFPLEEIQSEDPGEERGDPLPIGVWQGLADGDPDVDAIHRLVFNRLLTFRSRDPVALPAGTYCPFNSQNTLFQPRAFPLLYLPATVSFRFTDILRGYVAQRCLWASGLHLGFTAATVAQERNEHDLIKDFRDEIDCYLHIKRLTDCLDALRLSGSPLEDLVTAYRELARERIVADEEQGLVEAWARDVEAVTPGPRAAVKKGDAP